jgi:hypothetical protein
MLRGVGGGSVGVVCWRIALGSFGQTVLHIGIGANLISSTSGCADNVAQSMVPRKRGKLRVLLSGKDVSQYAVCFPSSLPCVNVFWSCFSRRSLRVSDQRLGCRG